MPWAQNPAATKKPATSLSPRMNSPSGVNASGPLMSCVTSASARHGTSVVGRLGERQEAVPVRRQERVVERGRDDAVHAPRIRVALVAADDQPADLLAEVHEAVRVAHRRQVLRDRLRGRVSRVRRAAQMEPSTADIASSWLGPMKADQAVFEPSCVAWTRSRRSRAPAPDRASRCAAGSRVPRARSPPSREVRAVGLGDADRVDHAEGARVEERLERGDRGVHRRSRRVAGVGPGGSRCSGARSR